jgi:PAB1-binding protein PBP1
MAIEYKILENFLLHVILTRSWIRFQTNKTLLGVRAHSMRSFTSSKLERGPQMHEREREALRIVCEIKG